MSTPRQQSFLATLWLRNRPVNTLGALLGKPAWVTTFYAPSVSKPRDDSAMLSCQPGTTETAMLFYFRHTDTGYRLYVREPGAHFGQGVVVQDGGCLGVVATTRQEPSVFELRTPDGQAVTLADLDSDLSLVALAHGGASVSRARRAKSAYEYLAVDNKDAQVWVMKIAERNVPWLSNPDEA